MFFIKKLRFKLNKHLFLQTHRFLKLIVRTQQLKKVFKAFGFKLCMHTLNWLIKDKLKITS